MNNQRFVKISAREDRCDIPKSAWRPLEDVHDNLLGILEHFHHNGLQTGDYLIIEDIVISNKNETVLFLIKARNLFCHRLTKN